VKNDVSKSAVDELSMRLHESPIPMNVIEEEFNYEATVKIVCELMRLSALIPYQRFSLESSILILKPLWNVLEGNYHLVDLAHKSMAEQNMLIFNCICISLSRLLEGPHQMHMKQHLKKLGLHKKLFDMVNASSKCDMKTHKNLLQLIYWFNTIDAVEVAN
jgi:hypothetical protein